MIELVPRLDKVHTYRFREEMDFLLDHPQKEWYGKEIILSVNCFDEDLKIHMIQLYECFRDTEIKLGHRLLGLHWYFLVGIPEESNRGDKALGWIAFKVVGQTEQE